MKKIFLVFTISILAVSFVFAEVIMQNGSYKGRPMTPCKSLSLDDAVTPVDGLGPAYYPMNTDDPIGDVFQFGITWNDIQHNASCGRQVQVDDDGWIHVAWMNGLNSGTSLRHIYYQLMDPMDQLQFTTSELGVQVDQSEKAGYNVLEVYSDYRAMPAFHQRTAGSTLYHSALGFDYFPRTGAFSVRDLPWVYSGGVDLKVEWPHMDKDWNDVFHIVSTHNPPAGTLHDIYYCRAEFDPLNYTLTFSDQFGVNQQEMFEYVTVVASEVASSPVSDKTAIGWLKWGATDPQDTTQYDNDLVIVVSEDGQTFDWENPINVTNWIPPDFGLLPDTLLADKDTLRCYPDMSLLYDHNDVLHVFFSTRGYYAIEGTLTWGNGFIWHWDEVNQVYSMVANGWFANGYYDPGAWNIYASRASGGVDETTGELYCMYQRYFHPVDTTLHEPYPYMWGDTTDWSAAGFPNGEIWMTKSTDGGYSWAEGIDVTNTHTPDAISGQCESELTPSMAPDVTDGYCHIFYILDKDAGAVNQSEGGWTLNDVVYHRVPTEGIPATPLLAPYPMHVDSSGFPYEVSVDDPDNLSPMKFSLEQNYPNPFNPKTSIEYSLNTSGFVSLKVYDIQGREVAVLGNEIQDAGRHSVAFDASSLSSGVYFYKLEANGFSHTRKMVLMK